MLLPHPSREALPVVRDGRDATERATSECSSWTCSPSSAEKGPAEDQGRVHIEPVTEEGFMVGYGMCGRGMRSRGSNVTDDAVAFPDPDPPVKT